METLANMQLVTNEISMKVNDIPDGEFKIIPKFTRSVGMLSETKGYMELVTEITNTPDNPFPVDIKVSITAVFDMDNFPKEQYDSFLKLNAVQIVFPYVRNIISNITTSAMIPPIILPIVDVKKLFPEILLRHRIIENKHPRPAIISHKTNCICPSEAKHVHRLHEQHDECSDETYGLEEIRPHQSSYATAPCI